MYFLFSLSLEEQGTRAVFATLFFSFQSVSLLQLFTQCYRKTQEGSEGWHSHVCDMVLAAEIKVEFFTAHCTWLASNPLPRRTDVMLAGSFYISFKA